MLDVISNILIVIAALLVIIGGGYVVFVIFSCIVEKLKNFYNENFVAFCLFFGALLYIFVTFGTIALADKFNNDNFVIIATIMLVAPFIIIPFYILGLPSGVRAKLFSGHNILSYYHTNNEEMKNNRYTNFIIENLYKIELFVRPSSKWDKITLANKILSLEIDIRSFIYNYCTLTITDKINRKVQTIEFHPDPRYLENKYILFQKLCGEFNYETGAEDVIESLKLVGISQYRAEVKHSAKIDKLCLDINTASEAELTAIPGITIAKAKRAIKLRKEKTRFSSVKEFYKEINLDEKFFEQIDFNGRKIILNELPLYRKRYRISRAEN